MWTAKDVFFELGFERTSMDIVASRAKTSKRSLYAHFKSKEYLFLAVVDAVRDMFLSRLGRPRDYPGSPEEVLVIYCSRYLEALLFESSIQMFRLSAAEAARFPAGASQYFDVVFTEVQDRISDFLASTFASLAESSDEIARRLLGQILYPRLPRAVFAVDQLAKALGETLSPDFDSEPIRKAVAEAILNLKQR